MADFSLPPRAVPRHSIPHLLRFRRAIKRYSVMWCNLAVVWAVDTIEPDALSAVGVQDFDGIVVGGAPKKSWLRSRDRTDFFAASSFGTHCA